MQDVIHLPDLAFVQYCQNTYHINRGVYNTIEQRFYENGAINIQQRRQMILTFLQQLHVTNGHPQFGAGGLKQHMQQFWIASVQ